jgi:glycosyltransferase involved in cell wall biosynthesis
VARHLPSVTLIAAVFNEAASIDGCLDSLAAQSYRGPLSMVVADGGSNDDTRERLAHWEDRLALTVVDNPDRRQSPGLNRAAAVATGDVLIRFDAHTVYAPDYVAASITALRASGAAAAGGALVPVGTTPFGRAVAAAMRSPLATGPGRFHREGIPGDVDTVYLGVFRRADFMALGGYRSFPSGAGEDADFYHRMRRRGWRVHLDPKIRSTYRPRQTPGGLLRQQFRYGQAKAEMLWANGAFPSWRPLAPALLVAGIVAGVAVGISGPMWPLGTLLALWLLA